MGTDDAARVWHRFEEAITDLPGNLQVPYLRHVTFTTIKDTPKGCWVKRNGTEGVGNKYFIRYSNQRNIAHATEADALRVFIKFKLAQREKMMKKVDIITALIKTAERQLPSEGK